MAGFTDEWSVALKAQNDLQNQREQDSLFRAQQGVDNEMREIMARTQREQAQKQLDLNNVMTSAIKMSGNGALPEVLRGYINRRYGWDGQTTGVLAGSGYQKDGNYVFRLGNGADNQGRVATQNLAFSRPQIFQMAQVNRAAFTDDDRRNMRYALLGSGMTDREVSALEFSLPGDPDHIRNKQRAGAGGRQIGDGVTFKGRDTSPRGISTFAANGKGDFSHKSWRPESGYEENYDTREGKRGNWKWIRSDSEGKLWINDKTGEEKFVKNGESFDGPQREAPSVEAARIRGENALALEEARQRGRVDLANLTGAQKKELQDMLLTAKKYGIAINAENALALEKMRQEGYDKRNASQEQVASLKTAAELMKDFDDVADELGLKGENREAFKTKLMNAFKETGVKEYAGGDAPAATPQEQVATPAAPTTTAVSKDNNQQAFRVLSQDEYRKLSAADQSKYFEALRAWKKSQAK